jgi:hypothetical protein
MSSLSSLSSLSSVSNSSGASYATQLAQTSSLENSLYNLGSAIQGGNLTAAGSILTAIIQANPQYATNSSSSSSSSSLSSSSSTQSQSPINQDFQNLATAIQNGDAVTAQSVWTQLKSDLANAGVTNISSGSQIAAQAISQNQVSEDQSILSSLLGGSDSSSPLSVLLNQNSTSSSGPDSVSAALSNWLTYQADGNTTPISATSNSGGNLNSVA